ncbi:MAG: ammonium transporter [Candidatus Riflebacteria bacterium]|nr:ammonium transporter [Candidatus Riflebacteria bacterium]
MATSFNSGDAAWVLTSSALVLLMTPGLSFFYGGMVSKKNVISTMFQSFISMGITSLLWVIFGFSLAFGDSIGGFIGNPTTFFMFKGVEGIPNGAFATTIPFALFALFQLKFAIITPALVTGAFAERVKFKAYMIFIVLFSTLIYAPIAHWTWHPDGFLRKWGVLDFAGGTVVHMSAGIAALVAAWIFGQRSAVIEDPSHSHEPANIPYILLGTGMLWFGWFGFNGGSSLAATDVAVTAFLTTNTASAAAMLMWLLIEVLRGNQPSAMGACIGAVVGLVAITPAAGYVTIGHSMIIGAIASFASYYAVKISSRTNLDDTLDVFSCHGIGGITGMILTGIFAKNVGLIYGESRTFLYHLLAVIIVGVYTSVMSYICFKIVDALIPLRVSKEEEDQGLDLSQHGEVYA